MIEPPIATQRTGRRERIGGYSLLGLLAYVPAILSDVGKVSADTKSYLYLDPERLVARAQTMWDPNVGLGTVTHQTIGYVFPMGPYYAAMERLGVPDWLAQRLWLGSLVFAAALGILALARQLGRAGPGVVVAALAYAWSPYLLHYSARLSALLMPWAALGFLLALAIRAVREGGWRAPLAFALVVQIVGGVNATSLVFAGVAPALWVMWAWLGERSIGLRSVLGVVARIGVSSVAMSLWWIAGLSIQGGYGINVLRYSETVAVVARTSAPNEVLRGLGYWFFYGRDRLGPWIEGSTPYTQNLSLIVMTYGLVALAIGAAVMVRWRHRGFFAWLLLVGTVVAVGAHPYDSPNPLGSLFKAFATTSTAGLALRSTPRAVPLVTLSLAMFLGAGVDAAVGWLRRHARPRLAVATPMVVGGLVLGSFPALWSGSLYGENLLRDEEVPAYWYDVANAIDTAERSTRVIEIPGEDFAAYRWGVTVDPITPGLIERPYVARELIPYGSAASADLLNALDRRLQESSADPDGFVEVLRRLGVGTVVVRNDIEWERYNLVRPRELAAFLERVEGLGAPTGYGPVLDPAVETPSFGVVDGIDERSLLGPVGAMPHSVAVLEVDDPQPIVRVYPVDGTTIVSGDGEGLVDAAEVGLVARDRAVLESAGLDSEALDDAIASAGRLVVTDSNRRRGRRWSTLRDNVGETETAGFEPIENDLTDARLPVFPDADDDAASVVEYLDTGGPMIATIAGTGTGNPIAYTPEDRPARAFDGDPATSWKTSAFDRAVGDRIEITLVEPITTDRVTLVQVRNGPVDRSITRVRLRFDGDRAIDVDLDDTSRSIDGQTIAFSERSFERLSIEVLTTNAGDGPLYSGHSAVGFAEIVLADRVRGVVRAHEVVRLPVDLTDLAPTNASVSYVMSRARIAPVPPRYDEELSLDRRFDVAGSTAFALRGTARVNPNPYDRRQLDTVLGIDLLDGVRAVTASNVIPGCWTCSAALAFDADPTTAWMPPIGAVRDSWIEIERIDPSPVDRLELTVIADGRHSLPTRLLIDVDGDEVVVDVPTIEESDTANATATVSVEMPRALTGRRLRISVQEIDARQGSSYYDSAPRDLPVAIASTGIVATNWTRRSLDLGGCRHDLLAIDGEAVGVVLRSSDRTASESPPELDRPEFVISTCGDTPIALAAGTHTVTTARGVDTAIDIDRLVIEPATHSTVVSGAPDEPSRDVRVVNDGRTSMTIEVAQGARAAWLVLGQSHNAGWHARVDGVDLGAPTLIDGYANGWIIAASDATTVVELEWTPQRRVRWALLISGAACLGAIAMLIAMRRRHGAVARGASDHPTFGGGLWPLGDRSRHPWPWARASGVGVALGAVTLVVVPLWVAAVLGLLAVAALRGRRTMLALAGPAAALLVGVFIAVQQARWKYPPIFEWPTLFPRVRPLGWLAAVVPALVWVVDRLRGEHDAVASARATTQSPAHEPDPRGSAGPPPTNPG